MENDIFHYNFPLPDFEACVADHMVDIVTVMVHELIRVFHYNFPLPDFEACVADHMVDIVTVMVHELSRGNIAVHCHAGHGRTGTAIAACLMRIQGLTPREAVELVRSKRITEETLSLMNVDVTIRGQSWYADRVRRGMNILNLENFLE
ncbi:dual specificity phosphatase, catalytic domain protein, partial [Necator americanus]